VLYADHDTGASRHDAARVALEAVYDGEFGQPYVSDYIFGDILARCKRRGTTSLKQSGVARQRRGFLQGKPHFEGGFRTGTPQASSVRVSDSASGVLWQCHNCTRPVASHRLPVSKTGSLPTGQGGQRCWPPR